MVHFELNEVWVKVYVFIFLLMYVGWVQTTFPGTLAGEADCRLAAADWPLLIGRFCSLVSGVYERP